MRDAAERHPAALDQALGVIVESLGVGRRLGQPPQRIAGEPRRDGQDQRRPERLVRERGDRALIVRRLPAAQRGIDREPADQQIDQPARGKAQPGEQGSRGFG
jgi:hypothetical protein